MQAKQTRSDKLYMTTLDTGRCSHMVSVLGSVVLALGIYSVFGYLDHYGSCDLRTLKPPGRAPGCCEASSKPKVCT